MIDVAQARRDCRAIPLRHRVLTIGGVDYCRGCGRRLVIRRRTTRPSRYSAVRIVVTHAGLWSSWTGC